MQSFRAVVLAPLFDDDLCLLEAVEDFTIQQLFARVPIEAFVVAVRPGAARLDKKGQAINRFEPASDNLRDYLRAIVRADVLWDPLIDHRIRIRENLSVS